MTIILSIIAFPALLIAYWLYLNRSKTPPNPKLRKIEWRWHRKGAKMIVPEIPHSAVLFVINKNYDPDDSDPEATYKATRYAWHLDPDRVKFAEYVLAVYKQTIIDVFVPEEWVLVTPETPKNRRRYAFNGKDAPDEIFQFYSGMPLPETLKTRSRNPVKYANC